MKKVDTSALCPFCKEHAYGLSVRLDLERKPPEEFDRFTVLLSYSLEPRISSSDRQILSCPDCGTIFKKERFIDNEPGLSMDTLEYSRLSAEEAEKIKVWWQAQGRT